MTTVVQSQTKTITKLPDGPNAHPLVQIIQGIFKPFEYLEAAQQRYGDIFTMRNLGFPPTVVLSHPEAIQEVFNADPSLLDTVTSNKILAPLFGENSLIQIDGVRHQYRRKLLMPPFHGQRMRAYGQTISEVTQEVMGKWQVDQPFCARTSTQEISLRVILRAVFGLDKGERYEQLRQLLSSMTDTFNSPLASSPLFIKFLRKDLGAWSPWGHFIRQKRQINALLTAEIHDRKSQPELLGEDILSLMMTAQDENGQSMTEEELRDELMTMLFAGHETTASALAWAFYWIHRLPEVREKLLQELDSLGEEDDYTAVAKLPYLNAVCSETLRLYPVVLFTFARILKSPLEIMGYQFEAGTALAPCIYLTHHREDLYPEPKRFKPERFLERQFSPSEYLPFGGGNRRCLGYAFAQYEMKLVLATILSQVQLKLADSRTLKPVRRGVTFTPASGVQVVMTGDR
ncbi:MAG: cytochrome P450 [Coleofasciculaceae cyanobacterium]